MHIGFILDGNRRWAKANGLHSFKGHKKGYENLKTIAEAAINRGVKYISAYIFSTENWNRSKEEVSYLMDLALQVATSELEKVHEKNIKVIFLSEKTNLSPKLIKSIEKAEEKTAGNTKGTLALCFNYGGRQEIVSSVKQIIKDGIKPEDINNETIAANLYHPELPDADLIIRTSGEQRLSNFMLWRSAYSELYFTKKHWPEFSEDDLDEALLEFAKRERRFGGDGK